MKKLLIVVDMQNDFIDGALGTKEAVAIVPNVVKKINDWDGDIIATRDTHTNDYMNTREGKYLPVPHCIKNTPGHEINETVKDALMNAEVDVTVIDKITFGSVNLPKMVFVGDYEYVELIGLCTDICVVSNALMVKANFYEKTVKVDSSCSAGVTVKSHNEALNTMRMCQIEII
jgi:nicotinamidase-related amidase